MDIHGVHLCYETGIYAGTFRLDTWFLHNQTSNSNSVDRILFTWFLAVRWYMVCLNAMYIDRANPPGTFRHDSRFLHNQTSNSNSFNRTLFPEFLTTQ